MAILSQQSLFSDDQAITTTAISENVYDLGPAGTPYGGVAPLIQDVGKGVKVPLLVQVTEDFAGATSLTITVEVADNAALSSGAEVVASSGAILVDDLTAGYQLPIDVLPNGISKRYLGLRYTVVGTGTAGRITAGISMGNQTNIHGA